MNELENRFHKEMINTYLEAKKLKYNAAYFLQMVTDKGGYMAAKQLVHTDTPSEGFTKLWQLKRLDLSVEVLVLKPEYQSLFTNEERQICIDRLRKYEYIV